jgi:hypothetical protein
VKIPRRINVTLSPEVNAAVREWADTSGLAASQLVSMIMTNSLGVILGMNRALKVAKTDPTKAMEIMSEIVDSASVTAAQLQLGLGRERKKLRRSTKRKA